MLVKANQPDRRWDLERLVEDPGLVAAPGTAARRVAKGHGRLETRRRWASTALAGYTAWPGVAQARCVARTVVTLATGAGRRARADAITSRPPHLAAAATLRRRWRGHGGIENRRHWLRDVVVGEDRAAARAGGVPPALAAARHTVIGLLRAHGHGALAATRRHLARAPEATLLLLGLPSE